MHSIRTSWDKIIRWFDANAPLYDSILAGAIRL